MTMTSRLVLFACCPVAIAASLQAQAVQGAVVEERSGVAIPGAFVVLLDADDAERGRVMTDALGHFSVPLPGPGPYRLRATAVGRSSWLSEPFTAGVGETVSFNVPLAMLAVALPALVVEADRECRVRPEAGLAAAALWEEARKALEAVAWTERHGLLRHSLARYSRRLDPRTLEVLEQEVTRFEGVYRGSPFVSPTPRLLIREGFVRELPTGEWEYYSPDASLLLSEAFADVHCFAVAQPDPEHSELVGLAFAPVRGRDVPDIDGVLWIDAQSAELRFLEYRYTDLPRVLAEVASRVIGGRTVFRRLTEGPWIIERWRIRMPEMGLRARVMPAGHEVVLLAVREQGGWVDEVRGLDGRAVWLAPSSSISGTVTWLGGPLREAGVELLGANRRARADRSGRFAFDRLVPGSYALVVQHRELDSVGAVQPPTPVSIASGDSLVLDLLVPSPREVRAARCPGIAEGERSGMLAGLVRDSVSGNPLPSAPVQIDWQEVSLAAGAVRAQEMTVTAVADEWGYYYACGLPADRTLRVSVADERFVEQYWRIVIGERRVAGRNLAVIPREP